MNLERLQELAALNAVGTLKGAGLEEFRALLGEATDETKAELASFNNVAGLLAASTRPLPVRPEIKSRIMAAVEKKKLEKSRNSGFKMVPACDEIGWQKLLIPGASIKLLSIDEARGHAVVLGKLEPGAKYPAHTHSGPEEVYLLSGDLHLGEHTLKAGDFHHSDSGTSHGINYSVEGCTLLAVISLTDLMAYFPK